MARSETALIIGAGSGLSASLARLFHSEGMRIALAARNIDKLAHLSAQTNAICYTCDVSRNDDVDVLFDQVTQEIAEPDIVVFNPSARVRGPVTGLDPERVQKALLISCYGGFLVGRAAARQMSARGSGTILFTGATASVKGFAHSASFAMGKFALRGLAQSMARELAPKNIHVAHFVIDGGIGISDGDDLLHPDAIAQAYLFAHRQHRSAWTWEVELRPWTEKF
jgi:NAD(P)-dependent dehydrogenase (short-subunit alcohol dehydrogenase family)